jgi:peroxiredoxin
MVANSFLQVSPAQSPRLRPGIKLIILTAFSLIIMTMASCIGGDAPKGPASDFQVTLFDGTRFRLSDQIGQRAVVLNFWFPSCPPCRAEMPDFERSWQQVKDEDVLFLGLFVPQGFDTEQDARDFIEELGLTYSFATDTGAQITLDYKMAYFPTTIFIDKSGRLVRTEISTLDAEKLTELVLDMF